VADLLSPTTYPIGSKRICVDTDYYATFNRDNVRLVDIRDSPIETFTREGLRVGGQVHEIDTLVFATGYDAMTGSLLRLGIVGRDGRRLSDAWQEGPKSYLGLGVSGFPNLFTVTGPGSPSVLSNMIVSIEQHVEWIARAIMHVRDAGVATMEAREDAQEAWVEHVNWVAEQTLFPQAPSWYVGANVPGKPRVFMPYAAGVAAYRRTCDQVAADDYQGFDLRDTSDRSGRRLVATDSTSA
jgi:cyclohexanone monooxygenase